METLTALLVKELCTKRNECECCKVSLLCGFILSGGEFIIKNKKPCIVLKSNNKESLGYIENEIIKSYNAHVTSNTVDENASLEILKDCEIILPNGEFVMQVSGNIFACENCTQAFLRGVFLCCGRADVKLSSNLKASSGSGYRVIFSLGNASVAETLAETMAEFDLDISIVRGETNTVYISGFENVRTFLIALGATKSLLKLENENIAREIRANSNRAVNAAENNIKKSIALSEELFTAAKTINELIGISKLPSHLKDICRIALDNQGLSLNEIAKKLGGKISKSGVNHRVRSIRQIYKNLLQ